MYVGGELPWLNLTHVRDDKLCRESFLQRHARSAVLLVCLAWCDVEVVGKVLVCFGQTLITCHFHGIFFSSHKREESVEKSSGIPPSQPLSRLYSFKQLSQNKWKKRFIANCERNWNVRLLLCWNLRRIELFGSPILLQLVWCHGSGFDLLSIEINMIVVWYRALH